MGRFVAIAVIAALGAGFYAGLRMSAPDMKIAADENFDGTNLMDIRVMSTLGLSDAEIEMLRCVDGVEAVMPAYETDAVAEIDGSQYAVRIHSLDVDAAQASDVSDGMTARSDDPDYINRLVLTEGEWPVEPGECLLGEDVVMDTEVEIGDTVVLADGADDLEDTLRTAEFTVTGFARCSYYASPTNLGTTSLGSGTLDQFVYVPTDAFVDDIPYTEAFLTVEGARDEAASSTAYDDTVALVAERIEAMEGDFIAARVDDVKGGAQQELDSEREDYEAEKADAESQLDDARAQLDEAKAQLDEAQATMAQSEQELTDGQAEYDAGVAELAAQRAEADQQLADAQSQLDEGRAQYEDAVAMRAELQEQLDEARAGLEVAQEALEARTQLEAGIAALDAQIAALDPALPGYSEILAGLLEQKAVLETRLAGIPPRAELEASINQAQQGIATLEGYIAEVDSRIAGLSAEYFAVAQAELDERRALADQQFAAAQSRLDAAASQLQSGWEQLVQGRADYQDGVLEYESGLVDYQRSYEEAQLQFAEAEEQLADAQRRIDEIENPRFYVLDRSKLIGAESFESDANRIDQIAQVFPLIFFLVAALVSLTTMTRMVEEERVLIGTHKALGYSKARITSKYLIYAFAASGIGSVVGIAALTQFLPYFIMNAYSIVYAVPQRPTPIDPGLTVLSAGLSIGITMMATWVAAASTLRESPAALMQPRAPKAGKRILLERIPVIWRRFSFSWKVTARNIFRYKQRFFMAVVGIAGCTALLLTGLGLQNAINDIIDKQFYQIYRYSMVAHVDDEVAAAREAVDNVLEDSASMVDSYEWLHTANIVAAEEGAKDQRLVLVVPEDPAAASDYVLMRERIGHAPLSLSDDGVIVSEKLARELGLAVGDEISIYQEDDIGDATGEAVDLPIAGVMENYISQYLFITPALYEKAFGATPVWDTVYAQTTDDEDARAQLSERLLETAGVKTVGYNDEQIGSYRTMLASVDSVVVVLIVAAAALAFVVLYNLTNINIAERAREIATLKVLGFTRKEVNAYIFRETMILSVIGAAVGLVLGIFLEAFVVQTAEVDQVMFGREIHGLSFVIAFVLTLVFTVLVMMAMRGKLRRIDMVESLKSNE